eukprot:TRINITY_DN64963_c0_g1_i1.p1 TRINITY_DN64963_c0_g1~~TRINITY_DN64963_c0_g1_i1.p1  ORF type:complete len:587 (+),score=24.04 TRINITY_DN64963_c0_g1_i1:53-1813(+)
MQAFHRLVSLAVACADGMLKCILQCFYVACKLVRLVHHPACPKCFLAAADNSATRRRMSKSEQLQDFYNLVATVQTPVDSNAARGAMHNSDRDRTMGPFTTKYLCVEAWGCCILILSVPIMMTLLSMPALVLSESNPDLGAVIALKSYIDMMVVLTCIWFVSAANYVLLGRCLGPCSRLLCAITLLVPMFLATLHSMSKAVLIVRVGSALFSALLPTGITLVRLLREGLVLREACFHLVFVCLGAVPAGIAMPLYIFLRKNAIGDRGELLTSAAVLWSFLPIPLRLVTQVLAPLGSPNNKGLGGTLFTIYAETVFGLFGVSMFSGIAAHALMFSISIFPILCFQLLRGMPRMFKYLPKVALAAESLHLHQMVTLLESAAAVLGRFLALEVMMFSKLAQLVASNSENEEAIDKMTTVHQSAGSTYVIPVPLYSMASSINVQHICLGAVVLIAEFLLFLVCAIMFWRAPIAVVPSHYFQAEEASEDVQAFSEEKSGASSQPQISQRECGNLKPNGENIPESQDNNARNVILQTRNTFPVDDVANSWQAQPKMLMSFFKEYLWFICCAIAFSFMLTASIYYAAEATFHL